MSEQIDKFRNELQAKVDEANQHLRDLSAKAKAAGDSAHKDAKAHLASLESKLKEQRAKVQASEATMKAWVEQKKTVTNDKIAEWKAQRQASMLARHADGAERYAAAATEVAVAAIDEAEEAIAEAVVARMEADTAKTPSAAKRA